MLYVFQVTCFILKGSNQEQPLQRSFARRDQNSGQKQQGSTGPLWKTLVLAEVGSLYLQVNSLPCNRVVHLWTNIIHVPTHNIYREFCSAMRRAKGDQCTMKIPLKLWLTVREPCSPMQGICNKINISPFLSLLPSSHYVNSTALEVLEWDKLRTYTSEYIQLGKESHSLSKEESPTFSSNMEYLSCSDLNISCGGIFIFASFAACNIKHALTSQLITDNLTYAKVNYNLQIKEHLIHYCLSREKKLSVRNNSISLSCACPGSGGRGGGRQGEGSVLNL